MDYKFQVPFVLDLFDNLGLPKMPLPAEDKREKLGEGRNSIVFKSEVEKDTYSVKKTLIYYDTPLLKYREGESALFQTGFSDAFLNFFLSPLPHIQKLKGYNFQDSYLYLFREFYPFTLEDLLKEKKVSKEDFLYLQVLLTLLETFQNPKFRGYHFDARPRNILARPSTSPLTWTLRGKKYTLPSSGFELIFTDFSSSLLLQEENFVISRHQDYTEPIWIKRHNYKIKRARKGHFFPLRDYQIFSSTIRNLNRGKSKLLSLFDSSDWKSLYSFLEHTEVKKYFD